ncbi:MAG: AAA family ATPase [Candidatus Heimdallarchaeota archaeon]|nr:AAA family ATPase [Candidatus Heimdallarchaeota archaeon]
MNPLIIGTTGLPSSGKGLFCEVAENLGFNVLVMGDVIREECIKRGLPVNRESSDIVMLALRKERGLDAVASITLDWIHDTLKQGEAKIIIDGIRSVAEVEAFRSEFPDFTVIALHADPKTRLQRALHRRRQDDAFSAKAFLKRDQIELEVGIGDVIAMSDILISTKDQLEKTSNKFAQVLNTIMDRHSLSVGTVETTQKPRST